MPTVAFRVLDAPHLKDDYYCSVLAYSYSSRTLAVALTHKVYLWTEEYGVRYPPLPPSRPSNFVTSLAFSSEEGGRSILAVARHNGNVAVWSLLETRPRFEAPHPCPACCVSFRPTLAYRQSSTSNAVVPCEDLLVGDDVGRVYYYSLEWPDIGHGSMVLLTKLDAHSQNICGLAWTPDGRRFASGGNDNVALLFDVDRILNVIDEATVPVDELEQDAPIIAALETSRNAPASAYATPPTSPGRDYVPGTHPNLFVFEPRFPVIMRNDSPMTPPETPARADGVFHGMGTVVSAPRQSTTSHPRVGGTEGILLQNVLASPTMTGQLNMHERSFAHSAAVKALAFAPWQSTLLASGGGSNDRQIHFHHTESGTALAVINVFAQVTSLVWSTTRCELAATFGYAQPEHEVRIAVFAWPSCECVVRIPWERKLNGEIGRALWAIPYPGGPNDAVPTRRLRTEGFAA